MCSCWSLSWCVVYSFLFSSWWLWWALWGPSKRCFLQAKLHARHLYSTLLHSFTWLHSFGCTQWNETWILIIITSTTIRARMLMTMTTTTTFWGWEEYHTRRIFLAALLHKIKVKMKMIILSALAGRKLGSQREKSWKGRKRKEANKRMHDMIASIKFFTFSPTFPLSSLTI